MAVYAVFTYDILDPERYAQYAPGSMPILVATLAKHGGEITFADPNATYDEGEKKHMSVCIKFPSAEAVHAWENDPEYAPAKAHRVASTGNYTVFIAQAFQPPPG